MMWRTRKSRLWSYLDQAMYIVGLLLKGKNVIRHMHPSIPNEMSAAKYHQIIGTHITYRTYFLIYLSLQLRTSCLECTHYVTCKGASANWPAQHNIRKPRAPTFFTHLFINSVTEPQRQK